MVLCTTTSSSQAIARWINIEVLFGEHRIGTLFVSFARVTARALHISAWHSTLKVWMRTRSSKR